MFFYLSLVTYQYLAFVDIVNTVLVFFNHHLTTGQWSSPSSVMKGCSLIVISATRTKAYKWLEHDVYAWVRSTLPVNVPTPSKKPFFERVVFPIKTDSRSVLVKRHLACEKKKNYFCSSDLKKMLTNVKEVSVSPRPRGSLFCLFRRRHYCL